MNGKAASEKKKKAKIEAASEGLKSKRYQTMGKLLNSLQLQTFLILWIIYIADGAPYSSEYLLSERARDREPGEKSLAHIKGQI